MHAFTLVALLLAITGLAGVVAVWRWSGRARRAPARGRWRRWLGRGLRALLVAVALVLMSSGGVLFWYSHRAVPSEAHEPLYVGMTYHRHVRRQPRPLLIHRVVIDLRAPGLRFLVTPGRVASRRQLKARTTSAFLTEFRLQLAINGQTFFPFYVRSPWSFFPRPGDRVSVNGFNASRGIRYSRRTRKHATLYLSADNRASIGAPIGAVYNAISADQRLLAAGVRVAMAKRRGRTPQPRTAMGLDRQRRRLTLVVVDGRQPNFSEGVTLWELAGLMASFGCTDALSFDGGGSSALVARGSGGQPRLLNSPIHTRVPGRERPVANHLGVWAASIKAGASATGPRRRAAAESPARRRSDGGS